MKRPFALLGASAFGALAAAAWLGTDLPPALAPVLAGLGLCALLIWIFGTKKLSGPPGPGAFFTALGSFALALLTASLCLLLYENGMDKNMIPCKALDGKEARIRGTVLDYPEEAYHKAYYRIRVTWTSLNGKSLDLPEFTLRLSAGQPFACEPYDTVECTAKLYSFQEGGLYSSRNSYWADGVALGGYLSEYGTEVVTSRVDPPPGRLLAQARRWIGRSFEKQLPKEEAGLIRGMLLGEKSRVSDRAYGAFRKIGCSHLLVVSGLHMAALAAFLSLLLGRLGAKRILKNLLTACGILFFLCLIGFPPSAQRSGWMFLLYLAGDCLGREPDSLNSLGAAVFLICVGNPFSGGDLSFALSAASTLGLLLFADPFARGLEQPFKLLRPFGGGKRVPRILRYAASSLGVTFSVLFTTLPIQLAVFGGISLLAPLSNLVLVFPCTLLLYISLAAVFLSALPLSALASPFLFFAGWMARAVLWAAEALAAIPAAFLDLSQPARLLALGLTAFLGALCFLLGRGRAVAAVTLAGAVLLLGCGWTLESGEGRRGTVTLAAAEDSSCVVLIRDGRAAVLSLGGYWTGAAVALLSRNNVKHVETLCLPVRDQDAREAAAQVLASYGADKLVLPDSAYMGRDLALAGERSARAPLEEGGTFQALEGVVVTASSQMERLTFSVNGVPVIVETGASGEGRCDLLFTTQPDSRINSAFTVLQNDAILEENSGQPEADLLAKLPKGRYLLPGGDSFRIDLLPDGTVSLRGDSLCLKWEKQN